MGCAVLGIFIGLILVPHTSDLKELFNFESYAYQTLDEEKLKRFENMTLNKLAWAQLIPNDERSILEKYQTKPANTALEFGDQILLSIQASGDQAYRDALQSINTVGDFDKQLVSISGFIVPLSYDEDQNPSEIFIVPYFGACLHFPPPPPNQIIFTRLSGEFSDFDITQAYTLTGVIRQQMFDDELGTSAYALELSHIKVYLGEPDDFRQH
jgi:hypothetical protein